MANRWDGSKWVDDATGNVMVPVDAGGDGVWRNPQGGSFNAQANTWSNAPAPVANGWQTNPGWNAAPSPPAASSAGGGGGLGFGPSNDPALAGQQADTSMLAAKAAGITASKEMLTAQAGLVQPQQGYIAASQGALAAKAAFLPQERAVDVQALGDAQASAAENAAIATASQDFGNIADTAARNNARRSSDIYRPMTGLAPVEEIIAPEGVDIFNMPGVRSALLTRAERLKYNAAISEKQRASLMSVAKAALGVAQNDVEAANLIKEQAGITLDQARQAVELAKLSESYARIQQNSASLEQDWAKQPPEPGMVENPVTGRGWVTPEEANRLKQTQNVANDKLRDEMTKKDYGDDPIGQLAALGEPRILAAMTDGSLVVAPGQPDQWQTAYQALRRLGRTHEQADQLLRTATTKGGGASGGGAGRLGGFTQSQLLDIGADPKASGIASEQEVIDELVRRFPLTPEQARLQIEYRRTQQAKPKEEVDYSGGVGGGAPASTLPPVGGGASYGSDDYSGGSTMPGWMVP